MDNRLFAMESMYLVTSSLSITLFKSLPALPSLLFPSISNSRANTSSMWDSYVFKPLIIMPLLACFMVLRPFCTNLKYSTHLHMAMVRIKKLKVTMVVVMFPLLCKSSWKNRDANVDWYIDARPLEPTPLITFELKRVRFCWGDSTSVVLEV